jgi:DNA (cytosine-5)-methyltransferase 1
MRRVSLFAQAIFDTHEKLIVDLFAGGGGASSGIEQATGRMVDIAINHNAAAVELHSINHPQTKHFQSDVFEVEPRLVCQGRPVGLLWASPDCTFHSKARGAKPIRHATKKRRALAWVVTRWAGQVRPDVIFLENVEEFAKWGPLRGPKDALYPCPKRKGKTFRNWVKSLTDMGYVVEWKELRACDYGAPTIRKRLFLIARCDGHPIIWPAPTHADPKIKDFKSTGLKPWRAVAECIDWSIPMLSIFATKDEAKEWGRAHGQSAPIRPLADKTMARIARGVKRYVVDSSKPFIVENIAANLISYHDHDEDKNARCSGLESPINVIDTANRHAVVASFMALNAGGYREDNLGHPMIEPASTITGKGANQSLVAAHFNTTNNSGKPDYAADGPAHTVVSTGAAHNVVAAHLQRDFGESVGSSMEDPIGTITGGGNGHAAMVGSFLLKYYGTNIGHGVDEPVHTITSGAQHHGLVTVKIKGVEHYISDIAMRMLQPKELYLAQGFRKGYCIDGVASDGRILTSSGKPITKTEQVKMCGNSVSPPCAEALVLANCPGLVVRRAA